MTIDRYSRTDGQTVRWTEGRMEWWKCFPILLLRTEAIRGIFMSILVETCVSRASSVNSSEWTEWFKIDGYARMDTCKYCWDYLVTWSSLLCSTCYIFQHGITHFRGLLHITRTIRAPSMWKCVTLHVVGLYTVRTIEGRAIYWTNTFTPNLPSKLKPEW